MFRHQISHFPLLYHICAMFYENNHFFPDFTHIQSHVFFILVTQIHRLASHWSLMLARGGRRARLEGETHACSTRGPPQGSDALTASTAGCWGEPLCISLEESLSSFLHGWLLTVQPWSQQQKISILKMGKNGIGILPSVLLFYCCLTNCHKFISQNTAHRSYLSAFVGQESWHGLTGAQKAAVLCLCLGAWLGKNSLPSSFRLLAECISLWNSFLVIWWLSADVNFFFLD